MAKRASAGPYRVEWLNSADQILPELWSGCFPPPFEGKWFYRAMEHARLEGQFRFSYALISRNDHPVGIAPVFRMDVPIDVVAPEWLKPLFRVFPTLRRRPALIVGSPCSDEGRVGLLKGIRLEEVVQVLQDALLQRAAEERVRIIAWKDFSAEDWNALDGLGESRGMYSLPSYPSTCLALPSSGGFEDYLLTLNSSRRNKLRSKLRRSRARGELHAEIIRRPSEELLNEIFGLLVQTYNASSVKFEQLTLEYFRLLAKEEHAQFVLLQEPVSGRRAAVMLCLRVGDRVYAKYAGFDYSFSKSWFMYFRLWEEVVTFALSVGAREIRTGQTSYALKIDLGHALVPLKVYAQNRIRLAHSLFSMISRKVTWGTLDSELDQYVKAHPDALAWTASGGRGVRPHPKTLRR